MSHSFIGRTFGRLTVLSVVPPDERIGGEDARRRTQFRCRCECGNTTIVTQINLVKGRTMSCGCLHKESLASATIKHGLTRRKRGEDQSRLYHIWRGMKQRCYSTKNTSYKNYGARGITVCDEWRNDLAAFHSWAMENGYADDLSLDRIDNDGPYSPENCRWATASEQASNTRRSHKILYDGKVYTLKGLAAHLGTTEYAIYKALYQGKLEEVI